MRRRPPEDRAGANPIAPPPSTGIKHRVQDDASGIKHRNAVARSIPVTHTGSIGQRHSIRSRVSLQAYTERMFGIFGEGGQGGDCGLGRQGRGLGREFVALEDQDEKEASEDHGPEGDAEQGYEDVASRSLDKDARATGSSGSPASSAGRCGTWTRQCRPPLSFCLGRLSRRPPRPRPGPGRRR